MRRAARISTLALTLAACGSSAQPAASPPPSPQTTVAPALDEATAKKLDQALAGPQREDKERLRDKHRHPRETLAFFGLRDDMTVVELWPGGGWYTALLAPVLAERGKLTVTHFDPNGDPKSYDTIETKWLLDRMAKTPDVYAKVDRKQLAPPDDFTLGPDASADLVLTFRNVHNWIEEKRAEKVFAAAFRVLKPGGVLGVVDHRGWKGMTPKQISDTGYIPEDVVIGLAQGAGFRRDGESHVNDNPKDTKSYEKGVWALPPSFANKDKDREKYEAIGESDRFTLRFVKPRS